MATIGINYDQLKAMLEGNHNNYQDLTGQDQVEEILSAIEACSHPLQRGGGSTRVRPNDGKIDPCLCLARVWNGGHGAQCTRKAKEGGFCSQHLKPKHCKEYGIDYPHAWYHLGRVDEPLEKLTNIKARDVFLRKAGKPVCLVVSDSDTDTPVTSPIQKAVTPKATPMTQPTPKAVTPKTAPITQPTPKAVTPKAAPIPTPTLKVPNAANTDELQASPVDDETVATLTNAPSVLTVPVDHSEDDDEDDDEEEDADVSGSESESESESDDEAELPDNISMKIVGGKTYMICEENQVWDWHSKKVIGEYSSTEDKVVMY